MKQWQSYSWDILAFFCTFEQSPLYFSLLVVVRCTQKHSQVHTVHLGSLWKSSSWNLTSRNSYNLVYHSPFLTIDLILVHMANSQGVETRDGGQTNDEQSSLETKGIILSPHRIICVQQGWLNNIEIAIRYVSPLPQDQKHDLKWRFWQLCGTKAKAIW